MGNTCYLNAALRALISVPMFTRKLKNSDRARDGRAARALRQLLDSMSILDGNGDSSSTYRSLKEIRETVASTYPQFGNGMQNDAHEFLLALFDVLEQDSESIKEIVTKNFDFVIVHNWICEECNVQTSTRESYRVLSLEFPDEENVLESSILLDTLIARVFQDDHVERLCERCRRNTQHILRNRLGSVPNILIVHISRFAMKLVDGDAKVFKVTRPVVFNGQMTLRDVPSKQLMYDSTNINAVRGGYNLMSVVKHVVRCSLNHIITGQFVIIWALRV